MVRGTVLGILPLRIFNPTPHFPMPKHLHAALPMSTPRRSHSLRALGVALCLSAGLGGCNNKSEMLSDSATAETLAHSAADKLQTYRACYHQLDDAAQRSIARYRSWVTDMDQGPSGQEKVVHGVYKVSVDDIAQCRHDFNAAHRTRPSIPALDTAAIHYGDALKALGALVTEADTYYSRSHYKDDAFSKGKAMHVLLAEAMASFTTSSKRFADAIGMESDKAMATRLAVTGVTTEGHAQRHGSQESAVKAGNGLVRASHTPSP